MRRRPYAMSVLSDRAAWDVVRKHWTTWYLLRTREITLREVLRSWWVHVTCAVVGHNDEDSLEYLPEIGMPNYEGTWCTRCGRPNHRDYYGTGRVT